MDLDTDVQQTSPTSRSPDARRTQGHGIGVLIDNGDRFPRRDVVPVSGMLSGRRPLRHRDDQ